MARYLFIKNCRNTTVGFGIIVEDERGRFLMFDSRNKAYCVKRWRERFGENKKHFTIIDNTL